MMPVVGDGFPVPFVHDRELRAGRPRPYKWVVIDYIILYCALYINRYF